jgi:16S rRNA (guanine527-N7)-methyltransferase
MAIMTLISRAFAETAKFVALTRHLLAKEGSWVAMKGVPQQALERLPNDVGVERVIPLQVPGLDAARCLIMLKFT